MNERSDQELLREYAGCGSEQAFTALVKRHTSLVYGIACRKLGNPSEAEEITQAVFVILARKAAFLCHREYLAGWLHQTALLECRQRLRSELRRERREEIAMHITEGSTGPNRSSIVEELDDALLDLSEKDRQPLLLRFFEGLALREVATRLDIREDAAQKRVAKSLALLERILRKRRKEIGPAALAVVLTESAHAAPAGLAASVSQAALSATGSATGLGVAFGKFMALTKMQIAALCVVAIGTPLLLQTQQLQAARLEQFAAQQSLAFAETKAARRVEEIRTLRRNFDILQLDRAVALREARSGSAPEKVETTSTTAKLYRWSNDSAYIRLPKSILDRIRLTSAKPSTNRAGLFEAAGAETNAPPRIDHIDPIDAKGNLSDSLAEALALDQQQRADIGETLRHFAAQFDAVAARHTVFTNSMPPGIDFSYPQSGQLYSLQTQAFPEEGQELKRQLLVELENQIGPERTGILMKQGGSVFDFTFLEFGARDRWVSAAVQENGTVTLGRTQALNGQSFGGSVWNVKPNEVPDSLRPYLPQNLFAKHE